MGAGTGCGAGGATRGAAGATSGAATTGAAARTEVMEMGAVVTDVAGLAVGAGSDIDAGFVDGVAELLPTSVVSCGPGGWAVVSFWHPAIEAPLTKTALEIANEASILRVLQRGAIGDMPAFRHTSAERYSCNETCRGTDNRSTNGQTCCWNHGLAMSRSGSVVCHRSTLIEHQRGRRPISTVNTHRMDGGSHTRVVPSRAGPAAP